VHIDTLFREPRVRSTVKRWGKIADKAAWLVLALALVVGALVRLEAPRGLHIDETVSFLAATCRQREFAALRAKTATPFAHWVPASEWQAFLKPASFGCLREISHGLAETDLHPPLYFWLLHFWQYLVPPSMATGPSLNAPIALASGLLLFALAKELFKKSLPAALAVLAWAANPYGLEAAQFARPYELLGLVAVLFAWRAARWVERPPATREELWRASASLGAVALAGVLTHYSFVFVLAPVGLYLLLGAGLRRALVPLASIALGVVASNLLHPTFRSMLFGPHERTAAAVRSGATRTLFAKIVAFFAFNYDAAQDTQRTHVLTGALLLGVIGAATVWLAVRQRHAVAPRVDVRFLVVPVTLVASLSAGITLGFVPIHATHTRHLVFFWPLCGIVFAYPFALAQKSERVVRWSVAGAAVAVSAAVLLSLPAWTSPWPRARGLSADCERLVVPGTRRTSVFRAVLYLDPRVLVFVGSPADLDNALNDEPVREACVGRGEQRARVERVLARHHVTISGRVRPAKERRKRGATPEPPRDGEDELPSGED
jgi:uncharacterized membrane protein